MILAAALLDMMVTFTYTTLQLLLSVLVTRVKMEARAL